MTAFTVGSANIWFTSCARSSSLPARYPYRSATCGAGRALRPIASITSTAISILNDSNVALAGSMRPTVSPGLRRGGFTTFEPPVRVWLMAVPAAAEARATAPAISRK